MEIKLFAAILALTTSAARATVPPQVPLSRSYQIFSPFAFEFDVNNTDAGESVFTSPGPSCLDYSEVQDLRQDSPITTGVPIIAGLPQFISELQTTAGIQFIATHGETGWIVIEGYDGGFENEPVADAALQDYLNSGTVLTGEARVRNEIPANNSGYWGIEVNGAFIQRILSSNADNNITQSIVFNNSCLSSSLSSSFSSPGIIAYLGYTGCPLVSQSAQDTGNIFNTMSGVQPIISLQPQYQNFSLSQGVSFANDSTLQPQPPNSGIVLYNAPRIVFAQVTQDVAGNGSFSNNLYNYPPGQQFADSYPYENGADYPGAPGTSGTTGNGPVLINLRFSEPMDTFSNFDVELRFSDGSTQDATSSGGWRTNTLPNDSWSATINLPTNPPPGKVMIAVQASKALCGGGNDMNNQALDTTGAGTSTPGNIDQSINFKIGTSSPLLAELGDFEFYQYFSGAGSPADAPSFLQTPTPSALPFVVSAACGPAEPGCISSSGAPLQSIVITDPNGNNVIPIFTDNNNNTLNSQPSNTDLEDSASSYTAYGSFTPTIPGPYTFTITNVDGGQTASPFQLASLTNQIDSASTSGYNPNTGNFTWSFVLDAQSNLGLDEINQYNPIPGGGLTDGPVSQSTQLNGAMATQQTYGGALQNVSSTNIETIDIDGNWTKYIISFGSSTSLLPSDACCEDSFPIISYGNASVTAVMHRRLTKTSSGSRLIGSAAAHCNLGLGGLLEAAQGGVTRALISPGIGLAGNSSAYLRRVVPACIFLPSEIHTRSFQPRLCKISASTGAT